jgi:hypothetical protein
MAIIGKSVETKDRLVVAKVWGKLELIIVIVFLFVVIIQLCIISTVS